MMIHTWKQNAAKALSITYTVFSLANGDKKDGEKQGNSFTL